LKETVECERFSLVDRHFNARGASLEKHPYASLSRSLYD